MILAPFLRAETERRIAVHRTVIASIERKGGDAGAYRDMLEADLRLLREGVRNAGPTPKPVVSLVGHK